MSIPILGWLIQTLFRLLLQVGRAIEIDIFDRRGAMRLKRFSVKGLFGIFNHNISLNIDEGITIIHAPNGYGKTVILRFIQSFFSGSMRVFREVEFDSIEIEFDSKEIVKISQFNLFADDARTEFRRGYKVELVGSEFDAWEPFARPSEAPDRLRILPSSIERYVPHLVRVGRQEWRDTSLGELLSLDEVVDRYWQMIPENYRRDRGGPEWLQRARSSVKCQLIETQRLVAKRRASRDYDKDERSKPAVSAYRDALASRMEAVLAESATLSQSLDRTFPNRLLSRMRDQGGVLPLSEDDIRSRLAQLEQKRARLTSVDLLTHSDDSAVISEEKFDRATSRILTEYVTDTDKKLSPFDDILSRLELFVSLINEKLNFTRLSP